MKAEIKIIVEVDEGPNAKERLLEFVRKVEELAASQKAETTLIRRIEGVLTDTFKDQ